MNLDLAAWLEKAKAYYSALEGRQRRNLWIIAIVGLATIIILLSFAANPNYETVFSNLDAKSLGQISQKLDQLKISYQMQGNSILVPASEADKVRADMALVGLPSSGTVDYSQIFQGNTFGLSSQELNLQVLNVLQDRIAQSIDSINGISNSQVNIVMPQQQSFIDPSMNYGAKASVLLTVGTGVGLGPTQIAGVQELVAHAVQGLSANNVTVVDQYGNDLSTNSGAVGVGGAQTATSPATQELSMQMQLQQTLQNQLQSSLINMVGAGNVSVIVHANVSFNQISTQSHTVQPGQVLSTQSTATASTGGGTGTTGTTAGGIAGQATQNSNLVTYGTTNGSGQATSSQRSTTTNNSNSYTNRTVVSQPMQVQGYTVSVLVNTNSVALSPVLRRSLQSYVLTAIGQQGTTALTPTVTVLGVPFAPVPGAATTAGTGFPGGTLGLAAVAALLLGVGAVALLVRRSRRRQQLTSDAIDSLSVASLVTAQEETPEAAIARQLKDLAMRRPDGFAALLRSWLTDD